VIDARPWETPETDVADAQESRRRRVRSRAAELAAVAVCAIVAIPLIFARLGYAPFDDPGEGMHAEIARELATRLAPFRLSLNGVPYADKPLLLYVLVAAACALDGATEAAARVVPAVAALVATMATAWLGARLLGVRWGIVAGLALLTCAGFFAYARYLRPDGVFVAALALGWGLMLHGIGDNARWATGLGLAVFGVASLAKDPLGVIAPLLTVGLALAICGRLRPLARWLPWPGVIAAVVLGFGWWVVAACSTPGFGWYTVVDNHVLNVVRARHFPDEDVSLSAVEFLTVAMGGGAPWVLAAGMGLSTWTRRRGWRNPAELPWTALGLWLVGAFAITALSPFRLPHYALPAYPALALLAARAWRELDLRRLARAHAWVFAGLALACGVMLLDGGTLFESSVLTATDVAARKTVATGAPPPLPPWDAFRPLVVRATAVLAAGAALTRFAVPLGRTITAGVVIATMMVGVLPGVVGGLEAVAMHRAVKSLAEIVATAAAPSDVVAHEGPIENSGAFEWYSGRRPVIVDGRRSVLGFGATLAAADTFWESDRLEEAWRGTRRVWLVTTRPLHHSIASHLKAPRLVAEAGGRRLYVNHLDAAPLNHGGGS
jgi:4-amino-4-deoxy-L-arabinose transferase-like glycosyltransferase